MKKLLLLLTSLIGFSLTLYGLITAIFFSNYIWYSFLTIGSLLFLAPISYRLQRHTLLEFSFKSPFLFLFLYLIFFMLGAVIDLFYGRALGHFWYYPHYNKEQQALHNLLIGYPFAFLSVIPFYEIIEYLILSRINRVPRPTKRALSKSFYVMLLIVSVGLVLSPIIDAYWLRGGYVRQLCILGMLGGIILLDSLREIIQHNSLLSKVLAGDYRYLLVPLGTAWLVAFIHEVPNNVPHAWVYQNIPFIQAKIFGVNLIVFFFGWLFLTLIPITIFRLLEQRTPRCVPISCLGLEKPARLLRIPYLLFWVCFAALVVAMRHVLLAAVDAHDPYMVLTYLIGIGIVWIACEIIWSYRALLKLRIVISNMATESQKQTVSSWYKKWVIFIYRSTYMAITGILLSSLFLRMIFKHKALCWTSSNILCNFDSSFYLFTIFLGGMSQFPFYGMSILAFALPKQPLENINLFLNNADDIRKLGRFFGLVGLGGLGLIFIGELWLYIAPVNTVWLYAQLIIISISFGALLWFFLTQYNVHKLMVREKHIKLDEVCLELGHTFKNALSDPGRDNYYKVAILTSLKAQLEQLPEWPFSANLVLQLVTAAGAVAGLIPLIELFKALNLHR